jgi:hypothetical protein
MPWNTARKTSTEETGNASPASVLSTTRPQSSTTHRAFSISGGATWLGSEKFAAAISQATRATVRLGRHQVAAFRRYREGGDE